jgi:hypothetical protein
VWCSQRGLLVVWAYTVGADRWLTPAARTGRTSLVVLERFRTGKPGAALAAQIALVAIRDSPARVSENGQTAPRVRPTLGAWN